MPTVGGASAAFAGRKQNKNANGAEDNSPVKIELNGLRAHPSLLEQMPEEEWSMVEDLSFEEKDSTLGQTSRTKGILGGKENIPA